MICLLQTKTADIAHTGIFASVTRPLSRFFGVGPGDKASSSGGGGSILMIFIASCAN